MSYNVFDIANKIIAKSASSDYGEMISNMKLQKMLYYMQGFHLAYFNTPLFENEIEAWQYGPVVPDIYTRYQNQGNKGIEYTGEVISLEPEKEKLFNEVYRVYGNYSAIGLMNMTHQERPWKSTNIGTGNIISKEKMQRFFKTRIRS